MSKNVKGTSPLATSGFIEQMNAISHAIENILNGDAEPDMRQIGFTLMVYPLRDPDGPCNYVSNGASHEIILNHMKEMIIQYESEPNVVGNT